MANKSFFETVAQYRLKVEKDGKPVVNVPGILALPGMLMAPKMSIVGLVAAPILGFKVHLENEEGKDVDVEGAVREAVDTVRDSATAAAKTIKEELDKAWEAVSADDPEPDGTPDNPESDERLDESADQGETVQDIVDELEKHEAAEDEPVIHVKPDDSAKD